MQPAKLSNGDSQQSENNKSASQANFSQLKSISSNEQPQQLQSVSNSNPSRSNKSSSNSGQSRRGFVKFISRDAHNNDD